MKIVVVIDIYDMLTNGTVMTAYRFVNALKERGHTVRVVATGAKGEDCYEVPERYVPIATEVSRAQQIRFGKPVVETLVNAFQGADVVHFYLPFKLEKKGRKIAEQMGIPCTGAFHLQPENVTYNCALGWSRLAPAVLYSAFKTFFYRHFDHIHCPSLFIADQLRKHRYKAKLHVISNGVDPDFRPAEQPKKFDPEHIKLLMIGRYANEKRQDVLIKAISLSKYADKIELTLAGKGPCRKKLEHLAAKYLKNPVKFGFFSKEQLLSVIRDSDLYVHAADVEIEAISCIEAFSCGVVPVIADSPKSATPQFALDERSLFKAGSAKDLAQKIDYWIEHPEEREKSSELYVEQGERYSLSYSIDKTEEMFREAISDYKATERLTKKELHRQKRKFGAKNRLMRFGSWLLYYIIAAPILTIGAWFAFGVKIRGKKNVRKVRKCGAVSVANHVHLLDAAFVAQALLSKKVIFTALESNFRIPFAGMWLEMLGATPVPKEVRELPAFFRETKKLLKKGRIVHFYPEGHLINYYAGLRSFSRGAFAVACDAQVPVLPVVISWRKRRGFFRLFGSAPCATVTVCPPIKPNYIMLKREMEIDLMNRTKEAMRQAYEASNKGANVDFYALRGIDPSEYHTKKEREAIAKEEARIAADILEKAEKERKAEDKD